MSWFLLWAVRNACAGNTARGETMDTQQLKELAARLRVLLRNAAVEIGHSQALDLSASLVRRRLPASAATVLTTRRTAMRRLLCAPRMPSSQRARTPNRGRQLAAVRMHATIFCIGRADWAGRFGKSGAVIIGAVLSKQKCAASSCWENASWHATSTVKSPNYRCERLC